MSVIRESRCGLLCFINDSCSFHLHHVQNTASFFFFFTFKQHICLYCVRKIELDFIVWEKKWTFSVCNTEVVILYVENRFICVENRKRHSQCVEDKSGHLWKNRSGLSVCVLCKQPNEKKKVLALSVRFSVLWHQWM